MPVIREDLQINFFFNSFCGSETRICGVKSPFVSTVSHLHMIKSDRLKVKVNEAN